MKSRPSVARVIFLFVLLFSKITYADNAGNLKKVYQELKDRKENYSVAGTVCEQVARLMFEKHFPSPDYEVETGIKYTDAKGRILGELDLVVFDHFTQQAVLVGEVKCQTNLPRAHSQASKQLKKLARFIAHQVPSDFFLASEKEHHFYPEQFGNPLELVSISQKGGEEVGFDFDLDLSLSELRKLQGMLLKGERK